MTLIDVDNIQHHENVTVVRFTKEQTAKFAAAIDENWKKVRDMIKGVELLTLPGPAGPVIRVGLWTEKGESP